MTALQTALVLLKAALQATELFAESDADLPIQAHALLVAGMLDGRQSLLQVLIDRLCSGQLAPPALGLKAASILEMCIARQDAWELSAPLWQTARLHARVAAALRRARAAKEALLETGVRGDLGAQLQLARLADQAACLAVRCLCHPLTLGVMRCLNVTCPEVQNRALYAANPQTEMHLCCACTAGGGRLHPAPQGRHLPGAR